MMIGFGDHGDMLIVVFLATGITLAGLADQDIGRVRRGSSFVVHLRPGQLMAAATVPAWR